MRKLLLPLLLVILLLSLLTAAASAQALTLPDVPGNPPGTSNEEADEAEAGDESEGGEDGESDECASEDGEDIQLCDEIAEEERESEEAGECVIEDAIAKLAPHPGNDTVGLAIRYESLAPAAVVIEARLRGSKGKVRLGVEHAHFRRAGVYRDNFLLSEREMERALAAREFTIELQALYTPRYCRLDLNGAPRRAKRSRPAGESGRSGGRAPTRDR
jgi:hypothetical protein